MPRPLHKHTGSLDDSLDGDDGTWDSGWTVLTLGVLLPLALLVYVVIDFFVGGVYLPRGGGRFRTSSSTFFAFETEPMVAFAVVGVKVFVAASLVTYYVIGNHECLGWYKDVILLPLLVLGAICVLLMFVGAAM